MTQGSLRLTLGVLALVVLWVLVYWWTPVAGPSPSIAFQSPPSLPGDEAVVPVLSPRPDPGTGNPSTPEKPPPAPRPGVTPPSFYQHTVARGETAETISKQYYGSADHWRAVMHANPKTDFRHLRAGLVVRVPVDPRNVQGLPAPAGAAPEPGHAVSVEYVVVRGDTLSELAQRFYGKASTWRRIVDANREALGPDGQRLRAGMKIIIPPAP